MNELMQTMTVREVAEVLDVTPEAIKRHIRNLWPNKIVNGYTTYLSAEEVTEIKKHMVPTSAVAGAVTEIEENETIAKALMILQQRADMYKVRAEKAEAENRLLMHTVHLYTITEIAKELGLSSAAKLNEILENKGIQYKVNGTWVPKCKYASCGYFEIKQEVHDNGYVYYDRKVTQEGRKFILELLNAEIA